MSQRGSEGLIASWTGVYKNEINQSVSRLTMSEMVVPCMDLNVSMMLGVLMFILMSSGQKSWIRVVMKCSSKSLTMYMFEWISLTLE